MDRIAIGIDLKSVNSVSDIVNYINNSITKYGECTFQQLINIFEDDINITASIDLDQYGWNKMIRIDKDVTICKFNLYSDRYESFMFNNVTRLHIFSSDTQKSSDIKEKDIKMTTIYYNITKLGGNIDIVEYINKHIQKNGYCTVKQLVNYFGSQALLVLPIYDEDIYGWTKQIDMNIELQSNPTGDIIPGYSFSMSIPQAEELILPQQKPVNVEMVNHPNHYNHEGRKECWEEMEELFGLYYTGIFDLMTAYKYFYRAGTKEGNSRDQDVAKMNNYLNYCNEIIINGASNISSNEGDMQTQQVALLATRYIALKHKIEREMTANPA